MNEKTESGDVRAPLWLVAIAFTGAMLALAGGYWDDAWHTERGRDEFLIAPHIAIYLGVAATGAALIAWAVFATRTTGDVRRVLAHRPLALALLAVAVTLASAPIDNFWHEAFGRDAVIWSPPHLLGIAGTLTLAAAILSEFASRRGPSKAALPTIAGALVLSAATFAVVEYDTDVPQFAVVWYLPALAFAASIAFAVIKLSSGRTYAATEAALVHLAFIGAVGLFLVAVDFAAPSLPLLVVPAVALDIAARRGFGPSIQAAAFVVALYAIYVPVRNWLGDGVELGAVDVAIGMPIAFVAVWSVIAVATSGLRLPRRDVVAAGVVAAVAALSLAAPPSAPAHDPGQGEDAGKLDLNVVARGRTLTLNGSARAANCRGLSGRSIAARRAGEVVRTPLEVVGCRFSGTVTVPSRGRWFVYAELRRNGRDVEAWLPVVAGEGTEHLREPARYAYEPTDASAGAVQLIAGALLYVVMAALVVATFALVRPTRAVDPTHDGGAA